jgi:hypothetical protein
VGPRRHGAGARLWRRTIVRVAVAKDLARAAWPLTSLAQPRHANRRDAEVRLVAQAQRRRSAAPATSSAPPSANTTSGWPPV